VLVGGALVGGGGLVAEYRDRPVKGGRSCEGGVAPELAAALAAAPAQPAPTGTNVRDADFTEETAGRQRVAIDEPPK
jgi:hypothetical protein